MFHFFRIEISCMTQSLQKVYHSWTKPFQQLLITSNILKYIKVFTGSQVVPGRTPFGLQIHSVKTTFLKLRVVKKENNQT